MTTSTQEVLEQMRQRNPLNSVEAFIMADQPVTEADAERIQKIQAENYLNRDRIPEALLPLCDAYVKMCGKDAMGQWNQEPTQRVLSDWLLTFNEMRDAHLTSEHIQAAFIKANSDQGFPVGRPGALTVTAIAMKTKATANVQPAINTQAIEYTKQLIEEKFGNEVKFVPRPAGIERPKNLPVNRKAIR